MTSPAWEDPLEDLYTDALQHAAQKPRRKADPSAKDALPGSAKRMREVFTLPENWERTRGVALMHAETGTLLGNYSEYVHRTVPGCRRLVHEHTPIPVDTIERVPGSWWLGERKDYVKASNSWTETRHAMLDIQLPELGVAFPLAELTIGLYLGGIMRVELAADTQLASPSGGMLLTLPKGTNILEVLAWEDKISLKQELGL